MFLQPPNNSLSNYFLVTTCFGKKFLQWENLSLRKKLFLKRIKLSKIFEKSYVNNSKKKKKKRKRKVYCVVFLNQG